MESALSEALDRTADSFFGVSVVSTEFCGSVVVNPLICMVTSPLSICDWLNLALQRRSKLALVSQFSYRQKWDKNKEKYVR